MILVNNLVHNHLHQSIRDKMYLRNQESQLERFHRQLANKLKELYSIT